MDVEKTLNIVRAVGGVPDLGPDDDIYDVGGIASINAALLLTDLEEAYGVTLEDDQFMAARTPRDLHQLVTSQRQ